MRLICPIPCALLPEMNSVRPLGFSSFSQMSPSPFKTVLVPWRWFSYLFYYEKRRKDSGGHFYLKVYFLQYPSPTTDSQDPNMNFLATDKFNLASLSCNRFTNDQSGIIQQPNFSDLMAEEA